MKDEKGHALVMGLLALAVGTLLVVPLMQKVNVTGVASRSYPTSPEGEAASSAGVEDAIWRLTNGDLAGQLPGPGDSVSYSLDEAINGIVPQVSVSRDHVLIASDGFESGGWSGGSGWLTDWHHESQVAVVGGGSPHEGAYHLQFQGGADYVKRSVGLSSSYAVRLYFWARAESFQSGEQVQLLVSANGDDWTAVKTWADGDDDGVYRFHDVDLTPFGLTGQFWIAFDAGIPGPDSYFYVDSATVLRRFPGSVLGSPSDDFESNGWDGGPGWLGGWQHSGNSYVTWLGWPYQGSYHMAILGPSGRVERAADLSSQQYARLQFWAKASWFEEGDRADCLVSADGVNWTSLISWTVDDSDWEYHLVEVDIPPSVMTGGFRVAFEANMSSIWDFFYVDDLKITGSSVAYEIVSTTEKEVSTVDISIENGNVTVHSWLTEGRPE